MSTIKNLHLVSLGLASSLLTAGMVHNFAEAMQGFSLADLAGQDTDDIKALESLLFPQGLYTTKVISLTLGMTPAKEGLDDAGNPFLPMIYLQERYEVLEATPLEKDVDGEALVGRQISNMTRFFFKNERELYEQIGLIKGRFQKAGLDCTGVMGGVEGGEPGWLDNAAEEIVDVKVTHSRPNAEGTQFQRVTWQKMKKQEEAA